MIRSRLGLLALGLVLVAAGCGGDGSSVNSVANVNQNANGNNVNNGPSKGDVGIFVTDGINDKYDHVWVSIKKIDLKLAAGGTRTIFDDERGVCVDLSSLHDDSGPKYRFINELTLPAGTYTGAQITLAKDAVLFPTNATSGKTAAFAGQADGAKDALLNVEFDPPKMLGTGHDDLVFDFDLSKWSIANEKLTAVVSPSLGAGLEDADRNAAVVQDGVIDEIKGEVPTLTFSLKKEEKKDKTAEIAVVTSSTTALVSDGPDPVVLKNGQTVEVSGVFDTNTRRFDATSIRLTDPKAPVNAQVWGTVSSIDQKSGTYSVIPAQARGLLPSATVVSVSVGQNARAFGASGLPVSRDELFEGLSASKSVHVLAEGEYDANKEVFSADEVRLQDADAQPHVRVTGIIIDPKSDTQSFGVSVTGYQGLLTKPGASAAISLSSSTEFADENGKKIDSAAFFAALKDPKSANVDGQFDSSTGSVIATSVKLATPPADALKALQKAQAQAAKAAQKAAKAAKPAK